MQQSERMLVVTVGTSLLTSATWKPEGPFAAIPGYGSQWCTEPRLSSQQQRVAAVAQGGSITGESIRRGVRQALETTLTRPDSLVALAAEPTDVEPPGRYSAELATIVCLFREERQPGEDRAAFFARRYGGGCWILSSADRSDEASIAATHLTAVFRHLSRSRVVHEPVLPAGGPIVQVGALQTWLWGRPQDSTMDIVVSGGYKIFATDVGQLLNFRHGWRSLYLHESSADLVEQTSKTLRSSDGTMRFPRGPSVLDSGRDSS